MLGLSQRPAGLPVGNRLQFSHDSLVPPRKGDAFVRGIRPPGTAEPRAVRPVLLRLRARRAASFADRSTAAGTGIAAQDGRSPERRRRQTVPGVPMAAAGIDRAPESQGGQGPRRGDPHRPKAAGPHHLHRLLRGPRTAAGESPGSHARPKSACTAAPRTRPGRTSSISSPPSTRAPRASGKSPPSTAGSSPTTRRSTPWNWSTRSGPTPSPDSAITTSPRKSTSMSSGTCSSAPSRSWKNSASAASSP